MYEQEMIVVRQDAKATFGHTDVFVNRRERREIVAGFVDSSDADQLVVDQQRMRLDLKESLLNIRHFSLQLIHSGL